MTKRHVFAILESAAIWAVLTIPIAAQVTTGSILGTVTDPGGVVPGANVTITEVNRGTSDTFVTDSAGGYTAPFLTPGTYRVEVNVSGFKKWVRDGIILQVNQRARIDVSLAGMLFACTYAMINYLSTRSRAWLWLSAFRRRPRRRISSSAI